MKKFIALFLVFSTLLLSGNMFAKERKGADLIIQRLDGTHVRGELIAVKQTSLLLLERDWGADVTVDIKDVGVINIEKKNTWKKAKKGFLIGSGLGIVTMGVGGGIWGLDTSTKGIFQMVAFVLFWGVSFAVKYALKPSIEIDKTFQFKGKSDSEIQEILEKLRKKARVKNAQ